MMKFKIISLIFIAFPLSIISQGLDIPEVTVYGERRIEVKPPPKGELPYEDSLIMPYIEHKISSIPRIEVREARYNPSNVGLRTRIDGGTRYEGNIVGFLRNYYYPVEVSVDLERESDIENDRLRISGKGNLGVFSFEGDYSNIESLNEYYFIALREYYRNLTGAVEVYYSDSIRAYLNLRFEFKPFIIEGKLDETGDYDIMGAYSSFPLTVGLRTWRERVYPDLTYFIDSGINVYLKGYLRHFYVFRYFPATELYRNNLFLMNPAYRIEMGLSMNPGISVFYDAPVFDEHFNYAGISGVYDAINIEAAISTDTSDFYVKSGVGFSYQNKFFVDIWGLYQDMEGYSLDMNTEARLSERLRIGINTQLKGSEGFSALEDNNWEVTGYLLFTL